MSPGSEEEQAIERGRARTNNPPPPRPHCMQGSFLAILPNRRPTASEMNSYEILSASLYRADITTFDSWLRPAHVHQHSLPAHCTLHCFLLHCRVVLRAFESALPSYIHPRARACASSPCTTNRPTAACPTQPRPLHHHPPHGGVPHPAKPRAFTTKKQRSCILRSIAAVCFTTSKKRSKIKRERGGGGKGRQLPPFKEAEAAPTPLLSSP
jgi:hypothetical protein